MRSYRVGIRRICEGSCCYPDADNDYQTCHLGTPGMGMLFLLFKGGILDGVRVSSWPPWGYMMGRLYSYQESTHSRSQHTPQPPTTTTPQPLRTGAGLARQILRARPHAHEFNGPWVDWRRNCLACRASIRDSWNTSYKLRSDPANCGRPSNNSDPANERLRFWMIMVLVWIHMMASDCCHTRNNIIDSFQNTFSIILE